MENPRVVNRVLLGLLAVAIVAGSVTSVYAGDLLTFLGGLGTIVLVVLGCVVVAVT